MKKEHRGVIQFLGYRMTDFQYHCDEGYNLPLEEPVQYNFGFQKKIEHVGDNELAVFLRAKVFIGDEEENTPSSTSVELLGRFSSDTEILPQWETNALAILFPYIRSIISSVTAQSGMPPIILPTVNLAQMFKESEK